MAIEAAAKFPVSLLPYRNRLLRRILGFGGVGLGAVIIGFCWPEGKDEFVVAVFIVDGEFGVLSDSVEAINLVKLLPLGNCFIVPVEIGFELPKTLPKKRPAPFAAFFAPKFNNFSSAANSPVGSCRLIGSPSQ